MNFHPRQTERIIRHAHLFCGVGAGAKGFNQANPRVGNVQARFECAGGIDVDPGAIANFERLTGVPGTVMDLFDRVQHLAFHGREPAPGWREATPADIYATFGPLVDVAFLSAPCKGFSGLLSSTQSLTDKYQALNALTLRGVWLLCEAYKDEPIPVILFENVPRIANRGRWLLDQISAILRSYGYNVAETVHDCGELGNLAQSRKRFLLIARQRDRIPNFIYTPQKHALRGVGEVIGKLPLPADPVAGAMHRVPALQWKTWVRLAFVPAGRDWRALNELAVENGMLRDFGIVPERQLRDNALGVCAWQDAAPLITGQRSPQQGRFSVADPRYAARDRASTLGVTAWTDSSGVIQGESYPTNGTFAVADPRPDDAGWNRHVLGVQPWARTSVAIAGRSTPTNGFFSVADPRPGYGASTHRYVLGVLEWDEPAGVIGGSPKPTCGPNAVADPRVDGHPRSVQLGVRGWNETAPCIKGDVSVGTGPYSIADPRLGRVAHSNVYRVVPFDHPSPAVTSSRDGAVADPRPAAKEYDSRKYKVTRYDAASRAVIGASTTGDGAFAVADPRGGPDADRLHGKYRVEMWIGPSRAVIGGRDNGAFSVADPRTGWNGGRHEAVFRVTPFSAPAGTIPGGVHSVTGGQPCVADPRPVGLSDERRSGHSYNSQAHYGVLGWSETSIAVPGFAKYDRGKWSVADPRPAEAVDAIVALPDPTDRLVCRIISTDETWHRPFTTLELGALQSIFDPEELFYVDAETGLWRCRFETVDLISTSDATKREWIGNAVPPKSARAIAFVIGRAILLAEMGETFSLSTEEIWVSPIDLALAVDTDQVAFRMDGL